MHGWAGDVMANIGVPNPTPKGYADVFFTRSAGGLDAAAKAVKRIYGRDQGRDAVTSWQTRNAQYAAVCEWGEPESRPAPAGRGDHGAGVHRERRQRPDDPARATPTCSPA